MLKNKQFVNKYQPTDLNSIILPNRIKDIFKNYETEGLIHSYIFYGTFGLGKTTLAKILSGYFSKRTPHLILNISKDTGIDTLRNVIEPWCNTQHYDILDNEKYLNESFKYVVLDEFERASKQLQEALKAFSVEYEEKGIRFILVTNHIHKIDGSLDSRFTQVNFNPIDNNEIKEMKIQMCKYIFNTILPSENVELDKDVIRKLVNSTYPDFRKCIRLLEHQIKIGHESLFESIKEIDDNTEILEMVMTPNISYDTFYHYLFDKFGDRNIGILLQLFETPFIHYIFEKKIDTTPLFEVNDIIINAKEKLQYATDPILLGLAVIGKIRKEFKIK